MSGEIKTFCGKCGLSYGDCRCKDEDPDDDIEDMFGPDPGDEEEDYVRCPHCQKIHKK